MKSQEVTQATGYLPQIADQCATLFHETQTWKSTQLQLSESSTGMSSSTPQPLRRQPTSELAQPISPKPGSERATPTRRPSALSGVNSEQRRARRDQLRDFYGLSSKTASIKEANGDPLDIGGFTFFSLCILNQY